MRRIKCPVVLRKYGWCGILALVYAIGLKMPTTEKSFDQLLETLQAIIGKKKAAWRPNKDARRQKRRGGISSSETRSVLHHHCASCAHTFVPVKAAGIKINVNQWLKGVKAEGLEEMKVNTKYILHTGKHAMFVDVPAKRGRWCLYDQGGPKTKANVPFMKQRGGVLLQKLHSVFVISNTRPEVP